MQSTRPFVDRLVFSRAGRLVVDVAVLSAAYGLAFLVRFDWSIPLEMLKRLGFTWPYVVTLQYALLVATGASRGSWRFVSLPDIRRIFISCSIATGLLLLARSLAAGTEGLFGYWIYAHVPGGVALANFPLAVLGVGGARVIRRWLGEWTAASARARTTPNIEAAPTLLVGAGAAGVLLAKEIANRPDLGINAVGFLDDDPGKRNMRFHELRVLGTTADILEVCHELGVRQVLITIANAPGELVRKVAMTCRQNGIASKVIPPLHDVMARGVSITAIRDIRIEDLLRREAVRLDDPAVSSWMRGRVVMVTGAGGSIGSELCRQVAWYGARSIVCVERAENNLFNIHRQLRAQHPHLSIVPAVADICDEGRLEGLFEQYRPEVVLHAAAHKHVPMMEWNPAEAVKNNVGGTALLANSAHRFGVERFVLISTDKAVNPSSIMGATKRIAELTIQQLAERSSTCFVAVRFGNVLGSNGSVIPVFQEQLSHGRPLTVTHPDMTRFFMTVQEACQLTLQAATLGKGGEIFILDMGEPVRIVDLAKDLIRLSGLDPDTYDIVFTGLRPGEKLFEEISLANEHLDRTRHQKIFVASEAPSGYDMQPQVDTLMRMAETGNTDGLHAALRAVVPQYQSAARHVDRAVTADVVH